MKDRTTNGAVKILALLAEEAAKDFARLDDDPATPTERLEEAALSIDAHALALASLPATTASARQAKARAALYIFGPAPTAAMIADSSHVDRALAASIVGDAIRSASGQRSAA